MRALQNKQHVRYAKVHTAVAQRRARLVPVRASAVIKAQATAGVRFEVEKTSWNSRRIFASISIATPKSCVWSALTDYDRLHTFIPSLVENRCLERNGNSVVVYQVGAQDVAMGVKFSAAVTLRCTEFPDGSLPDYMLTAPPVSHGASASGAASSSGFASSDAGSDSGSGSGAESLFPFPSTGVPGVVPSDITFELLEGDFQSFRGVWRMQQTGECATLLSYALFVKPQAWLPVALIQGRIENEVVRNLEAVCRYAESQHRLQLQPGLQ